ncbi:MAG TPA: VOC family protein [Jatrophihabitans sp.]
MISTASTQVWVHDQDAALDFYVNKLGMETRQDVSFPALGGFRWLTVGWPAEVFSLVLMSIPPEPVMDAATQEQVRDLMGKGFSGGIFLTTDDCQARYEELSARGVEFTSAPEKVPYGIDCGLRDPSGNSIRLAQIAFDDSVVVRVA